MLSQSDMMFGFCVCATLGGHIGETRIRQKQIILNIIICIHICIEIHVHAIFIRKNRQRAEKNVGMPNKGIMTFS